MKYIIPLKFVKTKIQEEIKNALSIWRYQSTNSVVYNSKNNNIRNGYNPNDSGKRYLDIKYFLSQVKEEAKERLTGFFVMEKMNGGAVNDVGVILSPKKEETKFILHGTVGWDVVEKYFSDYPHEWKDYSGKDFSIKAKDLFHPEFFKTSPIFMKFIPSAFAWEEFVEILKDRKIKNPGNFAIKASRINFFINFVDEDFNRNMSNTITISAYKQNLLEKPCPEYPHLQRLKDMRSLMSFYSGTQESSNDFSITLDRFLGNIEREIQPRYSDKFHAKNLSAEEIKTACRFYEYLCELQFQEIETEAEKFDLSVVPKAFMEFVIWAEDTRKGLKNIEEGSHENRCIELQKA